MSVVPREVELLLGLGDRGRPLTDREFADACYDEPWRYELVGGRLSVIPPNRPGHDDVAEPIRDALTIYKVAHPDRIERIIPEAWVMIRPGQQRVGDLAIDLRGPRSVVARPQRVPELMFEIVSRGRRNRRRDYEQKRDEYAEAGVLEYVVIDPFQSRFRVFRQAGVNPIMVDLTSNDIYTTPLLPGLAVPISEIL